MKKSLIIREKLWKPEKNESFSGEIIGIIKLQLSKKKNQDYSTWSSYKERKGNALALGADEGRNKLRKATFSRK